MCNKLIKQRQRLHKFAVDFSFQRSQLKMLVGLTAQKVQFRKWFRCQLDQRSEWGLQCLEKLATTVIEYCGLWKVLREFPNASSSQRHSNAFQESAAKSFYFDSQLAMMQVLSERVFRPIKSRIVFNIQLLDYQWTDVSAKVRVRKLIIMLQLH